MSAPLVINEERHDAPWTLAHRMIGGYMEPSYDVSTGRVTMLRTWADGTKAILWRETDLAYDGSGHINAITEKQYDSAGTLVSTRSRAVVIDPTTAVLVSITG